MDDGWAEESFGGDARSFLERPIPDEVRPTVWWFEADRSILVLGSSQSVGQIDLDACRRAGIEMVRRRSGGAAVLVQPGDVFWADVLIPTSHPLWTNDVSSSAWWLGEVWRATLASVGTSDTVVHRGPPISTRWSGHVCFAGVGGGEVVTRRPDGRAPTTGVSVTKIVGISQRRTRHGARFQCALYRRWRPSAHADLFVQPGPTVDDLRDLVRSVDVTTADLRVAFMTNVRR